MALEDSQERHRSPGPVEMQIQTINGLSPVAREIIVQSLAEWKSGEGQDNDVSEHEYDRRAGASEWGNSANHPNLVGSTFTKLRQVEGLSEEDRAAIRQFIDFCRISRTADVDELARRLSETPNPADA